MQSFFARAPMQFMLHQVDLPPFADDDVLVKIRACGVCGWDVLCAQEVNRDWRGIGHELSGEIVRVGSRVQGFQPGGRVAVENSTVCGQCEQCKRGNVLHCSRIRSTFGDGPGGFSEFAQVKASALNPIGSLDFRAAALAEPLTVALDLVEAAEIPLGGRVAVFGPGPIGLMAARLALLRGASRVYLTGRAYTTRRWEVARQLGVTDCVYIDQVDLHEYFRGCEPSGLDRVLVTAPPAAVQDAARLCRFGGIIAYNGIQFGAAANITLDGNAFHFNRLQLRGVHSIPNLGWPQAVDLLTRRVIDPDLWITQVFPFAETPEAVRFSANHHAETVKVMVDIG